MAFHELLLVNGRKVELRSLSRQEVSFALLPGSPSWTPFDKAQDKPCLTAGRFSPKFSDEKSHPLSWMALVSLRRPSWTRTKDPLINRQML